MALTNPLGGSVGAAVNNIANGQALDTPSGFNNSPPIAGGIANNIASNVTGLFSTRPQAKYASGARCLLKVNGTLVGFAFGISWRITTQVSEVRTVDNWLPYELVPQMISVDGTISALHIPGTSVGTLLWQPDVLNFLSQQYISIEARDSSSDQLLFYTGEAMITSRVEDIKVDQLAQVSLTFKAIGYRDERTPAVADGLNNLAPNGVQPTVSNAPTRLQEATQQLNVNATFTTPSGADVGSIPTA
jgi:hypothetical protein